MLCVRDVTELRQLEAEAGHQKRELEMIGQILKVNQEKFSEFVISARKFVADNEDLLNAAHEKDTDLVPKLFRNMHTIKGNARTYGLLHLTNIVHEAEQAYDELRKNSDARFDKAALLQQLQEVQQGIEEYATLNEVKLGRKGPGRRGSTEKYVMVQREQVDRMLSDLERINLQEAHPATVISVLQQVRQDLRLIGTERIQTILEGVFDSLPSLSKELGKEPPKLEVNDNGIQIRNQVSDLLRNVFMHLYRNSMDHGIETAADRLAQGKSSRGTIQLDLALLGDRLMLRLKDDGKGLALGYIRSKAIERSLITQGEQVSDEDVAKLIFAAGFSTAKAVTEVSGRGVGMDAVQDFIKREGGDIRLALIDNHTGAAFRTFETVISIPAKFAVVGLLPTETSVALEHGQTKHHTATDLLSIARDFLMPGKLAQI
jgi:chemotaxis protein histidine kinase CheA